MLGVISQVENGCQAVANSLLVLVPHRTLHGIISILVQRMKLAADVGKMRAVKNKMPLIPQRPGLTQRAAAEMPGDGWSCKPSLFNWHETPCGIASAAAVWKCALESQNMAQSSIDWGAETKQSMCRAWPSWRELFLGDMQTTPNLFELTLHVCLKPEGVQACNARR